MCSSSAVQDNPDPDMQEGDVAVECPPRDGAQIEEPREAAQHHVALGEDRAHRARRRALVRKSEVPPLRRVLQIGQSVAFAAAAASPRRLRGRLCRRSCAPLRGLEAQSVALAHEHLEPPVLLVVLPLEVLHLLAAHLRLALQLLLVPRRHLLHLRPDLAGLLLGPACLGGGGGGVRTLRNCTVDMAVRRSRGLGRLGASSVQLRPGVVGLLQRVVAHPGALGEPLLQVAAALPGLAELPPQRVLQAGVRLGAELQLVQASGHRADLRQRRVVGGLRPLQLARELRALPLQLRSALLNAGELPPQLELHVCGGPQALDERLALRLQARSDGLRLPPGRLPAASPRVHLRPEAGGLRAGLVALGDRGRGLPPRLALRLLGAALRRGDLPAPPLLGLEELLLRVAGVLFRPPLRRQGALPGLLAGHLLLGQQLRQLGQLLLSLPQQIPGVLQLPPEPGRLLPRSAELPRAPLALLHLSQQLLSRSAELLLALLAVLRLWLPLAPDDVGGVASPPPP
mmetsp:Transcript_88091/g.278603  ORF Transcript_88091/g.278603 Transcript_88091/m.278603 type:complete len:514 (-) Transcript_88091:322-1863(-)